MADRKEDLARYISEHIARAREKAGMTQEELGRAVGKTNVSISDIERGRVGVSSVDLILIAKTLNQPLNYFVPRPARIRIPEEELTTEEAKLVHDFRRLEYLELQRIVLNLVADLANWAVKGDIRRFGTDVMDVAKKLTGRD